MLPDNVMFVQCCSLDGASDGVGSLGRSSIEVTTSDYPSRGQGSNPLAASSEFGQVRSLHVASVHSNVSMSFWQETVVDICEQIVFAQ